MNPALHSRWYIEKENKVFQFTIVAIWGSGFLDKYRVNDYELQYDHTPAIQRIPAEKLRDLINTGMVKLLG